MDKIRRKLENFMRGRNGMDDLNQVILAVTIVLDLISMFTRNRVIYCIFMMGLFFFIYRFFSRDVYARGEENRRHQKMVRINKMRYDMRKEYRIFTCKSCGRNIRVPRGKGKIEVTCPVCGNRKIHRT